MSQPFLGEIRCFGFNFAPVNWAFCNGQLLPISQYDALFTILGTTYGGDGVSTFGLPNLQGRAPMHWGNGPGGFNTVIGEVLGSPTVQLNSNQIPYHGHNVTAAMIAPGGAGEHVASPTANAYIGPSAPDQLYKTSPTLDATFSPAVISSAGGSLPHENMQPYLALNFCIALFGVYPSRN
jgi:microcystin-dependent protein